MNDEFDMDADDVEQIEQENNPLNEKKPHPTSGISIDALHGLLDSYSTGVTIPRRVNVLQQTISTPIRSKPIEQNVKTPSVATFNARSNPSEIVVEHLGEKLKEKSTTTTTTSKAPTIQVRSTFKPSKYFYQTATKRATMLNKQIEEFEDLFLSLNDEKNRHVLHPIGEPVQDEVSLVGRIVCDSAGQLNAQSILLEGSQRTSKCARIHLDFSSLPSYSIFPGQIVLVVGTFSNANLFRVKQLFDPPMPPRPPMTKIKTDLNFLVAAGPFLLAQGNLTAFEQLIRRAEEDPTIQTLILLGPFIDERSSHVLNLQNQTYEEIFQEMINKILNSRVKTILIPSLRDVHHDSIYPLCPFQVDSTLLSSAEPSRLTIDGLLCALTSTDILCHLSSEEISSNQIIERMSRLIRHLFQQRSFYPLIPPHESVSIEYESFAEHGRIDSLPHLFITSSDLRPFIKFIDTVCVLNIGRLVKNEESTALNSSSGTYAKISLRATDDIDLSQGNNLSDYLHIQILRL